ncbi:MAG: hypothetical protein M1831_006977 [Alyxoria varia]|nr:MAG: hypothetical protein M1831_006977 [Alyxoria varia]
MSSSDAKQGGDLFDMAKDGTNVPHDAGKMNTIPSKPNPHQASDAQGGLGAPDSAAAADNPVDMPRNPKDMGTSGDVITGAGDQMPSEVTTKHAHYGGGGSLAKGSERYDKHTKSKESDLEAKAAPGPGSS